MSSIPADVVDLIDRIERTRAEMSGAKGEDATSLIQEYAAATFHGAPRLIEVLRDLDRELEARK